MGEHMFGRMKKTLAFLLLVCFVLSLTSTAVSANAQDYKDGCKAGYKAGYTAGKERGYADGYADGSETAREIEKERAAYGYSGTSFNSEDYRRGYKACYPKGDKQGYKDGYDEGFKDGVNA
jgi:flagellar biosynthesis/type III secretory pathway protein FliH